MTVAVAYAILNGGDYGPAIRKFAPKYPHSGYGVMFEKWIRSPNSEPYNSWGNGSAMRVGPVGFAFDSEEDVLKEARRSAEVTHNHPEGIKGAQATALAIYRAHCGASKTDIRQETTERFGYNLARSVDGIRPAYRFNESCQETVPEALICFFEGENVEDIIRKAVSLGGDADTLACIAGSVAEAFYGPLPQDLQRKVKELLRPDLLQVVDAFYERFMNRRLAPA